MSEVTLPQAAAAPTRETSVAVETFGMPTGLEEDWRFTPTKLIQDLLDEQLGSAAAFVAGGQTLKIGEPVVLGACTLRLDKALGLSPLAGAPFDRAGVVGWNNITSTLNVSVASQDTEPMWIDVCATGEASVAHVRITAAPDAQATIVLRHSGSGSLNETVEIRAERGANLTLVSVQDWDDKARHLATHQVSLGENAHVKHGVVTLGGSFVRLATGVALPERRADVNMLGLYFTNANVHHEHRLFIDHIGQQSKSRVAYKGALQGVDAHAVWVGDVGIEPEAYGTDSYEYNRNLVLGKGPRVDSVPNLEIHNGEIEGAGHASATGRFDDEQLFYLQSRGIDPVAAKRLVVKAFYAELLNEMEIPQLTEHVLNLVDSHLTEGSLQ